MNSKKLNELLNFDCRHVWHPYTSLPSHVPNFLVESAQDCTLQLADGRTLIDGMASWWSAIHGYNHPTLNQVLHTQTQKMAHVMFGGLTHQPAIDLAKLLCAITPQGLDYVFFSDSGSVAVEVAMKMALQFWQTTVPKKNKHHVKNTFLTVRGGYHGDTFATMSVCDPIDGMHHLFQDHLHQQFFAPVPQPKFHEPFKVQHIAQLRALCAQQQQQIAAIILEPIVQAAGGMHFYAPEYLKAVRELCDEFNLLLIADEIATGFGRTGKLFACEHANISPDILCLGKALTGGYMTLAATLCNTKIVRGIAHSPTNILMHGPTFMANPLACAIAKASIELLLSGDWQQNIQRIERGLRQGLSNAQNLEQVADVRVLGAIGVVELTQIVNIQKTQTLFVDHGVWVRPFGKLVYVMPPYIISDEEIHKLTTTICTIIKSLR